MLRAQGKPACLSTDGGSLFIEECLEDPPHCLVRAPDCPVSGAIAITSRFAVLSVSLTQKRIVVAVRVGQLWYYTRTRQLVSSFTSAFNMSTRDPDDAAPKCIATKENTAPARPPAPPETMAPDPSLPLQVWKGELGGSRLAVALVNAGNSSATITATWEMLGVAAGAEMDVMDAISGASNGTAAGFVRATVGVHDTAVFTLAPKRPVTMKQDDAHGTVFTTRVDRLKSDGSAAPRHYGLGRRQLFFDAEDPVLASTNGTSVTMHPMHFPDEIRPVVTATEPWEGNRLGYYSSVVDNGNGSLFLYYSTANDLFQGGMVTCLAVSHDRGRTFTKPSLGLSLFNGSRSNNVSAAAPFASSSEALKKLAGTDRLAHLRFVGTHRG